MKLAAYVFRDPGPGRAGMTERNGAESSRRRWIGTAKQSPSIIRQTLDNCKPQQRKQAYLTVDKGVLAIDACYEEQLSRA